MIIQTTKKFGKNPINETSQRGGGDGERGGGGVGGGGVGGGGEGGDGPSNN